MSDYDNWKNGLTDMFGSPREEGEGEEEQDNECPCGCGIDYQEEPERYKEEHKSLSEELFGKKESELDDWEYQEYMQQLDMLDEGLS